MLKKITFRLKRENAKLRANEAALTTRIKRFTDKLRGGGGAKPVVPDDLLACYTYALEYVTKQKYYDGSTIATFKDPTMNRATSTVRTGQEVINWKVFKFDEDLYDLELTHRWIY